MVATDRQQQAAQRLIRSNRNEMRRIPVPDAPDVGLRRRVVATLMLAVASPASAIPLVAACVLVGGLIGNAAGNSVLFGLLLTAVVVGATGWTLVSWVAAHSHLHLDGHRRWWPVATAAIAATLAAAELATGGRTDTVLLLWIPVGIFWSIALLARLRSRWPMSTIVVLALVPLCTALVFTMRLTKGLFDYRFDHSVDALDREADRNGLDARGDVAWFTIDTQRSIVGCDVGYRISGWWVDDARTIARCPLGPPATILEPRHLSGDWYWIRLEG